MFNMCGPSKKKKSGKNGCTPCGPFGDTMKCYVDLMKQGYMMKAMGNIFGGGGLFGGNANNINPFPAGNVI